MESAIFIESFSSPLFTANSAKEKSRERAQTQGNAGHKQACLINAVYR
jgi:hypothetical protein